jgi:hypothetical protein
MKGGHKTLTFPLLLEPADDKDVDVISLQTRSPHPMEDTSTLERIEFSFILPDIMDNMYETKIENPGWAEFLREFPIRYECQQTEGADDEEADPENNVLVDEECVGEWRTNLNLLVILLFDNSFASTIPNLYLVVSFNYCYSLIIPNLNWLI